MDDFKLIPLRSRKHPGLFAKVGATDFDAAMSIRWFPVCVTSGAFYAARYDPASRRRQYMHRWLMNPAAGIEVDHINGDKLDNRRSNLRAATHGQNMVNFTRRNALGYRGIQREWQGFSATVVVRGRKHRQGGFLTAEAAARAYDALAILHHGEFAILNFPTEQTRVSA